MLDQAAMPGYGIILDYNALNNTASVLMANSGSDDVGETYLNVPCPVYMGVQSAAPEVGRHCLVLFKDNSHNNPLVIAYFNKAYAQIDYSRQTEAINSIPRYILNL